MFKKPDGDSNISEYLSTHDVAMRDYAENMEQISIYEADMTYSELFEGQDVELWPIDEEVSNSKVAIIPVSDFNRALAMQIRESTNRQSGKTRFSAFMLSFFLLAVNKSINLTLVTDHTLKSITIKKMIAKQSTVCRNAPAENTI